jgi:hypothetical protein
MDLQQRVNVDASTIMNASHGRWTRNAVLANLPIAMLATVGEGQTRTVDADRLPTLVARAEARIGNADDPKRGFSMIASVAADRDGNVYVYDYQSRNVRVFAGDGRLLRTIGRAGEGPGEFTQYVGRIGIIGDTLWSLDDARRRLNLFRRDGTVVSTSTIPGMNLVVPLHSRSIGRSEFGFVRPDGRILTSFVNAPLSGGNFEERVLANQGLTHRVVGPTDTVRAPRVLYTPGSLKVDTVGIDLIPPPDVELKPLTTSMLRGRRTIGIYRTVDRVDYTVPEPPSGLYHRISLADGSVIVGRKAATTAAQTKFTYVRWDLAGKERHRIEFSYTPRRYTDDVLDSLAMQSVMLKGERNADAFRAVRGAMAYPQFQGPVYLAWGADDGAVWLRRESDASALQRWIIVDRSGATRGVVALPWTATPRWASGNVVIVEQADEDGVPWLVRYSLGSR